MFEEKEEKSLEKEEIEEPLEEEAPIVEKHTEKKPWWKFW